MRGKFTIGKIMNNSFGLVLGEIFELPTPKLFKKKSSLIYGLHGVITNQESKESIVNWIGCMLKNQYSLLKKIMVMLQFVLLHLFHITTQLMSMYFWTIILITKKGIMVTLKSTLPSSMMKIIIIPLI